MLVLFFFTIKTLEISSKSNIIVFGGAKYDIYDLDVKGKVQILCQSSR